MARIGGPFPFPTPQLAEGGGIVTLFGGAAFYPPPGEWVVTTGLTTVMQWWDPVHQLWRGVQQPTCDGQMFSTDGTNYRLINLSGCVVGAQITAAGSGAVNGIGSVATGVNIGFAAPASGQVNQTATAYPIVGGSVAAPTITQAGSGFLVPPLVVIDPPPPGGMQATAYATINAAGGISAINMINLGAGYLASPNFWLIPQTGIYQGSPSGGIAAGPTTPPGLVNPANAVPGNYATAAAGALLTSVALTGSGTLTGIVLINPGGGYDGTHIPAITITGVGAATAVAMMSLSLNSVTLVAGGAGYGAGAPPNWETSLGLVLGFANNHLFLPRCARGVTTVAAGAVATFVAEDPGFGFQKVPTVEVINTSAIATTIATGTAVVGGVIDVSLVQPRVQ